MEIVWSSWEAAVTERYWWDNFRCCCSNQRGRSSDPPACCCNAAYEACWAQGGDVTVRDGYYCLLPVTIYFEGARLANKDPLPSDGASCHADVVTDLEQLARLRNVPLPNLQCLLPHTVFTSSSGMLSHIQTIAQSLNKVAIIRTVDKSLGTMWGFCRVWVWEQTQKFLHAERYSVTTRSRDSVLNGLPELVHSKGWVASHNARLAMLYLIGKGKSMTLPKITWRPICAQSALVIPRWKLRIPARARTCFLKFLSSHITGSFLHQSIQDVGRWMKDLNSWNCTVVGEADCKD